MKKLLSIILSGLFTVPMLIVLYMLWSFLFHILYVKLIVPVALLYGNTLPAVPFYQWIIIAFIINVIILMVKGMEYKETTKDDLIKNFTQRAIVYISFIAITYLINWIWL